MRTFGFRASQFRCSSLSVPINNQSQSSWFFHCLAPYHMFGSFYNGFRSISFLTRSFVDTTMSKMFNENKKKVYKLVLTGGPCGGKTTGQARLSTFFENLGWKVFRVPECATVLMSGGVKWTEMNKEAAYRFQENLLRCLLQTEDTFFQLADDTPQNTLVICDRGAMDPSAFLPPNEWEKMKIDNSWNSVELRDSRYNQVIHMVTAANGAEEFYSTDEHLTRYEGTDLARHMDSLAAQAWVGHPYYDVIDNTTDFEGKVNRMIQAVCHRMGLDPGDRLNLDSMKRKFLIEAVPDMLDIQYQEFDVVHDYLVTPHQKMQARIRRRGQNGNWTYVHTVRRPDVENDTKIELKRSVDHANYKLLLAQCDDRHDTVVKKRRCFLWQNQYYQMDIYQEPDTPKCKGLILLETYTTISKSRLPLPDFLKVLKEVTDDPTYSMYTLSMREPVTSRQPMTDINGILNGDSVESLKENRKKDEKKGQKPVSNGTV